MLFYQHWLHLAGSAFSAIKESQVKLLSGEQFYWIVPFETKQKKPPQPSNTSTPCLPSHKPGLRNFTTKLLPKHKPSWSWGFITRYKHDQHIKRCCNSKKPSIDSFGKAEPLTKTNILASLCIRFEIVKKVWFTTSLKSICLMTCLYWINSFHLFS